MFTRECRGVLSTRHCLSILSSPPAFCRSLALFLAFVAAVLGLSLATGNIQIHSPGRQFLPIYLLKRNQAPGRYTTSLLVQNSSGESSRMRRDQLAQRR